MWKDGINKARVKVQDKVVGRMYLLRPCTHTPMLLTLMLLAASQTSLCLALGRRTYRPGVVLGGGGWWGGVVTLRVRCTKSVGHRV